MNETQVNESITVLCTNCGESNDTDNDMCRDCRFITREHVREWMKEYLLDGGMVVIGPYKYEPTRVLKSVDPIAYNEMFLDMCDSLARDGYVIEGYNDN